MTAKKTAAKKIKDPIDEFVPPVPDGFKEVDGELRYIDPHPGDDGDVPFEPDAVLADDEE